jgi:hypothetical protein
MRLSVARGPGNDLSHASQAPFSLAAHRQRMSSPIGPQSGDSTTGLVTVGSGWLWPAAFIAAVVALFYLPSHNPSSTGADSLIATVAALYVIGLTVVGVRVVRGIILRAGGSHEPIALLGRGPDPLISTAIRPRVRLVAVAAGAIAPVLAAVITMRLAGLADPTTVAHAIAGLALSANAVIAAGVLIPAPGFAGWAFLLGIVDAAGARSDQRVRQAARVAQSVGVPVLLTIGVAAAVLGHPMLMPLGFVLAFVTWSESQAAVAQDAAARFLAAHTTGQVARPITSDASPDEPIGDLVARLRTDRDVVTVASGGGVLGALGPGQLGARGVVKREVRCADVMVPLASLRLLSLVSPSVELLPELARHGFALVSSPYGLGYVEVSDLRRQIRIWIALGDRGARTNRSG